ncbi:MAG: hypothetical protein QW453_07590, partial [Thermoprotei archaeon]
GHACGLRIFGSILREAKYWVYTPPPVCWWMTAAIAYILTARVGVNFLSTYSYLEYTDSSAISNVPLLPSSTLHHLW